MSKVFVIVGTLLSCFLLLPCVGIAAPANVTVVVCGESSVGDRGQAEIDARRKAVGRVLGKMLTPNRDPNSLFQQLLNRHPQFIASLKVLEKKTDGNKLYLISQAEVKTAVLQTALQEQVSHVQDRERDAEACFLIRLKGLDTTQELRGGRTVYNAYKDSFEQIGFKVAGWEDEIFQEFQRHKGDSYETFSRSLEDKIRQDFPEITVAIIGEMVVTPINQDEAGLLVAGNIHIRSVDMLRQKEIAEFTDSYQIKWPDPKDAGTVVIHKSAINSASALADKTLAYWQKNK